MIFLCISSIMLTSIEFMASCKYLRFWNILTGVYLKRLLDSELVKSLWVSSCYQCLLFECCEKDCFWYFFRSPVKKLFRKSRFSIVSPYLNWALSDIFPENIWKFQRSFAVLSGSIFLWLYKGSSPNIASSYKWIQANWLTSIHPEIIRKPTVFWWFQRE